jgi:hypothetical protein
MDSSHNSPFVRDGIDFTSPSLSSAQLQHSPNSPFDSFEIQPPSPRHPHTPSYNGSYHNSPYTAYSDFSYVGSEITEPLGLFDDPASIAVRNAIDDYNPAEYDTPNSGGLLIFDTGFMNGVDSSDPQITLAVSPPADSPYEAAGSPYSHASPGSSNGHEESGHVRSRNSSVSSHHAGPLDHPDFSAQFDTFAPNGQFSPTFNKAQSPPRLIIQDSTSPAGTHFPNPPTINAPAGNSNGLLAGPQLNVVPATPVSGGGDANPAGVPFQTTLGNLQQSESLSMLPGSVLCAENLHGTGMEQPSWNPASAQLEQQMFNFSPPVGSPHVAPISLNPSDNFLIPNGQPSGRRYSDGSLAHPGMALFTMPPDDDSALHDDNVHGLMNFTPGSSPGSTTSFRTAAANGMVGHAYPHPQRPPHMEHNYTYGPPSSTAAHLAQNAANSTGLSPHMSAGMMLGGSPHLSPSHLPGQFLSPFDAQSAGPSQIRRARSDRGHNRGAVSEDFGNGMRGMTPDFPQFLAPEMGLSAMARGHIRRASSGTRSDRGIGGMPMSAGMVGHAWGISARSSPYPSPNASPRGPIDHIPLPDVSVRQRPRPQILGNDDMGLAQMQPNSASGPVQKQNVTTHATKDASEKRRKVGAAFVCPVPGCGSTFTRHFNLKGTP